MGRVKGIRLGRSRQALWGWPRDRRGFGLAMAIFALTAAGLAATVIVAVTAKERATIRWGIARRSLTQLESAVVRFHADIGGYPADLEQLTRPLRAIDRTTCEVTYSLAQRTAWNGPYLQQVVPPTGMRVGIGTGRRALTRSLTNWKTGEVVFTIDYVRPTDAVRLDTELDDADGAAAGAIRWERSGDDVVMRYLIPEELGC